MRPGGAPGGLRSTVGTCGHIRSSSSHSPWPTPSQGWAPPAAAPGAPRLGVRPEALALARKPRPDMALPGCNSEATPGRSLGPGHPPPRPPTWPLPRTPLGGSQQHPRARCSSHPSPRPSCPCGDWTREDPEALGGGVREEGTGEGAWEGGAPHGDKLDVERKRPGTGERTRREDRLGLGW